MPAPQVEDWTNQKSHSYLKLGRMIQAQQLDDEQVRKIHYLLDEQQTMIALFAAYGLLSAEQMQDKTRDILETTQFQIFSLFTADQMERWKEWDLRIVRRPNHSRIQRYLAGPTGR